MNAIWAPSGESARCVRSTSCSNRVAGGVDTSNRTVSRPCRWSAARNRCGSGGGDVERGGGRPIDQAIAARPTTWRRLPLAPGNASTPRYGATATARLTLNRASSTEIRVPSEVSSRLKSSTRGPSRATESTIAASQVAVPMAAAAGASSSIACSVSRCDRVRTHADPSPSRTASTQREEICTTIHRVAANLLWSQVGRCPEQHSCHRRDTVNTAGVSVNFAIPKSRIFVTSIA